MTNDTRVGPYDFCKGIGSIVEREKSESNRKHVLQLDLDDLGKHPREAGIINELPAGPYVVTRTGEGSYNVTSLHLFTEEEVIEAKANIWADDANHLKIGVRRGYWILRLSGKHERTHPEFDGLYYSNGPGIDSLVISEPHAEAYRKRYPDADIYSMLPAAYVARGEISLEVYPTRVKDAE